MQKTRRLKEGRTPFLSAVRENQAGTQGDTTVCTEDAENVSEFAKDERKRETYIEALAQTPKNTNHDAVANNALRHDEQTSQSKEKTAADKAEQRRRVHTVYEQYFISFMRIRYAWCIFLLLVCWLGVDLVVLFTNAMGVLNAKVLFVCAFSLGGAWGGNIVGYSVWGRKNVQEVKRYYGISDDSERIDFEEKNIQLRLWRSVRDSWGGVAGAAGGLLISHLVSHYCWPFGSHCIDFHLSDPVVITLIGSSTASVIGVFLIVLHWLFPQQKNNKDKHEGI